MNPVDVNKTTTDLVEDYTIKEDQLRASKALNILLALIVGILLVILSITMRNNSEFTSQYEPYTDGWCIEYTHYLHPTWSAEKCEDFVFMNTEMFNNKYNK